MKPAISNRAFGKLIGVHENAIRHGKKTGRLKDCLGKDGQIVDVELARQEWAASSTTGAGLRNVSAQEVAQSSVRVSKGQRRDAERLSVVRTREHVVIQLLDSTAVHRLPFPDCFVENAVAGADLVDEMSLVMSLSTARQLARLLTSKVASPPDVEDLAAGPTVQ